MLWIISRVDVPQLHVPEMKNINVVVYLSKDTHSKGEVRNR